MSRGDRFQTVDSLGDVEADDGAGGHGVVGGRGGHDVVRAGDRPGFPDADGIEGVVAVEDPHVGAVGAHGPELLVVDGVAIDVIPAGVDDAPVVQDGRVPLVGLVEGDDADVRAVGLGNCHGVNMAGAPPAAVKAAAAGGR